MQIYYLYRLFGTQIHEEVNNGQFKDIVERNTGLEHLNGSIFAYADKYYNFTDTAVADAKSEHAYGNTAVGVFSDDGASEANNGTTIALGGLRAVDSDGKLVTNASGTFVLDVRPNLTPAQVHTVEGTPTSGADSHEVIVATDKADYIHARAGDDTVYGEDGNDIIYGDGGVDRLYGGNGNDMIDTGEGPDLADGGAGDDWIYGRGSGSEVGGFDQLVGGSGNDVIYGGEGIDKLSGGTGDDRIFGEGNTDPFTHGGDGNDYIDGGSAGDNLYGDEGDDIVFGNEDQDLMYGGTGDDILRPGAASQAIGGGPDEAIGDDGYVNSGFDLIDYSDRPVGPGLTIDFVTQQNPLVAIDGTTPDVAWWQIEGAIGTRNDDSIVGDSAGDLTADLSFGNNWLIGGSGNDRLQGNGGNDLIVGGSIRLDELIGAYSGQDGYTSNVEDDYTGATHRATGILTGGLLAGAGFEKHFAEMLKSAQFKDLVLGDGGTDGTADTAVFHGNRNDYRVEGLNAAGTVTTVANQIFAYRISDLRDPNAIGADGEPIQTDGIDLILGVERFQFADITATASNIFNHTPVGSVDFRGSTLVAGTINRAQLAPNSAITDIDNITLSNPTGAATGVTYQWQNAAGLAITNTLVGNAPYLTAGGALVIGSTSGTVVKEVASYTDARGTAEKLTTTWNMVVGSAAVGGIAANNTLIGSVDASVRDAMFGLAGNDILNAGDGDDKLYGGAGNDAVNGGGGIDVAGFASGIFTASFSLGAAGALTVNGVAANGTDTLVDIERVEFDEGTFNLSVGTIDADGTIAVPLAGTAGADLMLGFDGADVLAAGAGNDILNGGGGADILDGGVGSDAAIITGNVLQAVFGLVGDHVTVTVGAETDSLIGIETLAFTGNGATARYNLVAGTDAADAALTGTAGDDILLGFGGSDSISAGGGADVISGGAGNDFVDGGLGSDTMVFVGDATTLTLGTNAANQITAIDRVGGGGTDTLIGVETLLIGGTSYTIVMGTTGSNPSLNGFNGTNGSQAVFGLDGADRLNGGGGSDMLIGGAGNDVMIGGAGDDTFIFARGFGNDVITDFDANPVGGRDWLDVSALGITAASFGSRVSIANFNPAGTVNDRTEVTIYTDAAHTGIDGTIRLNGSYTGPNAIGLDDFFFA